MSRPVLLLGGGAAALSLALVAAMAATRERPGSPGGATLDLDLSDRGENTMTSEARWSLDKKLASLEPGTRAKIKLLLERLEADGWQPRLIFAWRSPETQARLVKLGRSKVTFSFHNAVQPDASPGAMAGDIVDARYGWGKGLDHPNTAKAARFFAALGKHAKALGMTWGGDWSQARSAWRAWGIGWDPAHVQTLPNSQLSAVRKASEYALAKAKGPALT